MWIGIQKGFGYGMGMFFHTWEQAPSGRAKGDVLRNVSMGTVTMQVDEWHEGAKKWTPESMFGWRARPSGDFLKTDRWVCREKDYYPDLEWGGLNILADLQTIVAWQLNFVEYKSPHKPPVLETDIKYGQWIISLKPSEK